MDDHLSRTPHKKAKPLFLVSAAGLHLGGYSMEGLDLCQGSSSQGSLVEFCKQFFGTFLEFLVEALVNFLERLEWSLRMQQA